MPVCARPTSPSAACSSLRIMFSTSSNIASLSQGGRVHDSEGHIEHPRQGLCKQRLACAGRPDQHDVRFGQFDTVAIALAVHIDPLVMVVDGYRQLLFGLLLTDYVFVKKY